MKAFWGGLVGFAVGTVLLLIAAAVAVGSNVFVLDGADVVGVRTGAATWASLTLVVVAVVIMLGAAVAQFVAWLGAVLRTADLPATAWFVALLIAGLLGLGLPATLAYVIAGPDRTAEFSDTSNEAATSVQARVP
ncbi:MAG TPA: hypothetical protein VF468_05535, partial [Actinomycetota bacterium]|nr:hypothetical protein [Actinomycetota bacterium]